MSSGSKTDVGRVCGFLCPQREPSAHGSQRWCCQCAQQLLAHESHLGAPSTLKASESNCLNFVASDPIVSPAALWTFSPSLLAPALPLFYFWFTPSQIARRGPQLHHPKPSSQDPSLVPWSLGLTFTAHFADQPYLSATSTPTATVRQCRTNSLENSWPSTTYPLVLTNNTVNRKRPRAVSLSTTCPKCRSNEAQRPVVCRSLRRPILALCR